MPSERAASAYSATGTSKDAEYTARDLATQIQARVRAEAHERGVPFRCVHAGTRQTLCVGWEGARPLIALWGKDRFGCIGCGVEVRDLHAEGDRIWREDVRR